MSSNTNRVHSQTSQGGWTDDEVYYDSPSDEGPVDQSDSNSSEPFQMTVEPATSESESYDSTSSIEDIDEYQSLAPPRINDYASYDRLPSGVLIPAEAPPLRDLAVNNPEFLGCFIMYERNDEMIDYMQDLAQGMANDRRNLGLDLEHFTPARMEPEHERSLDDVAEYSVTINPFFGARDYEDEARHAPGGMVAEPESPGEPPSRINRSSNSHRPSSSSSGSTLNSRNDRNRRARQRRHQPPRESQLLNRHNSLSSSDSSSSSNAVPELPLPWINEDVNMLANLFPSQDLYRMQDIARDIFSLRRILLGLASARWDFANVWNDVHGNLGILRSRLQDDANNLIEYVRGHDWIIESIPSFERYGIVDSADQQTYAFTLRKANLFARALLRLTEGRWEHTILWQTRDDQMHLSAMSAAEFVARLNRGSPAGNLNLVHRFRRHGVPEHSLQRLAQGTTVSLFFKALVLDLDEMLCAAWATPEQCRYDWVTVDELGELFPVITGSDVPLQTLQEPTDPGTVFDGRNIHFAVLQREEHPAMFGL